MQNTNHRSRWWESEAKFRPGPTTEFSVKTLTKRSTFSSTTSTRLILSQSLESTQHPLKHLQQIIQGCCQLWETATYQEYWRCSLTKKWKHRVRVRLLLLLSSESKVLKMNLLKFFFYTFSGPGQKSSDYFGQCMHTNPQIKKHDSNKTYDSQMQQMQEKAGKMRSDFSKINTFNVLKILQPKCQLLSQLQIPSSSIQW